MQLQTERTQEMTWAVNPWYVTTDSGINIAAFTNEMDARKWAREQEFTINVRLVSPRGDVEEL